MLAIAPALLLRAAAPLLVTVAVAVLTLTGLVTVGRGVLAWWGGADVPPWIVGGLLVSGVLSFAWAVRGLVLVRRDRWAVQSCRVR